MASQSVVQQSQACLNSLKIGQEDPCGSVLMRGQQVPWPVQYCFHDGNAKDL